MKNFLIIYVLFFYFLSGIAQHASRFDFFIGYGYYEGFTAGSEYFLKSNKHSISTSMGYDKFISNDQKNISFSLGYNFALFSKNKFDSASYKWHINNKAVLWQLEDEFYVWRAISLIPSINRKFKLYRKIFLSADVGPSFNIVLYNKRKTFKEIGWPYHIMPDFRILLIF